jgi:PAS domain S-box-containing protein
MSNKNVKVLLIEDNPGDARLIREMLAEVPDISFELECAKRLSTGLKRLAKETIDVILLDLALPDSQGLDTLNKVYAQVKTAPIVVLTGLDDESVGIEAVHQGAQDYLLKGQIHGRVLRRVINYSVERKRMEEALRDREARYRYLFEHSQIANAVVGLDGKIIDVNQAAADFYGYDKSEIIGRELLEFIAPESKAAVVEAFARGLVHTHANPMEVVAASKGGMRTFFYPGGYNMLFEGGKHTGFLISVVDITERKRVEEALRNSEELYRTFFKTTRDAVFITTKDGKWIDFNDSALEVLGYKDRDELQEAGVLAIWVDPESRNRVAEKAEQQGFLKDEPANLRKKDNSLINVLVTAVARKDENGNILGYQGTFKDITERKRIELALQESERKYHGLVEDTSVGIASIDLAGNLTFVNRALCKIIGYAESKILGKPFADFLYPDDAQPVMELFPDAATNPRDSVDLEFRGIDGKGRVIHLHASVTRVKRENETVGFNAMMTDITERKLVEQALVENEEMFRQLFNSANDMIFLTKANPYGEPGRLLQVNDVACQKLGYSRSELARMDRSDIATPEAWQELMPNVPRLRASNELRFESSLLCKDGSTIETEHNVRLLEWRGITVALSIARDITERKKAEGELRRSEQNYRTLFDTALEGVAVIDGETLKVALCNRNAARIFGFASPEDAIGFDPLEAFHPDDVERTNKIMLEDGFEKDLRETNEFRLIARDGRERWVSAVGAPIEYQGKQALLVSFKDITERKEAEEELLRSRQELRGLAVRLQEKIEEERTLLAREIHDELGQALTALKFDLSWLSKRLPKEEKMMLEKTEIMSKVIDVTIKGVKRMATELRPGVLDDLGLIAAMDWQIAEFSERTGIKCKGTFVPEDLALGKDMDTAVFRIFQELLINVARHARATIVTASLKEKDGILELRVRDNGRGIRSKQFSSSKSLGLIGIRERVHYWGGDVKVMGIPGKGTTAIIHIPLEERGDDKNTGS